MSYIEVFSDQPASTPDTVDSDLIRRFANKLSAVFEEHIPVVDEIPEDLSGGPVTVQRALTGEEIRRLLR